jgi:chaperone modulatory protein CbpM
MTEPADIHFLDDDTLVPFADLERASGLAMEHLLELAEFGVFTPASSMGPTSPAEWRVSAGALVIARRAARLRMAFDLDMPGVAVALSLLERIEALQRELHELRCRHPSD